MSAISSIQPKGFHNFSIEKPTQFLDKRLLIEQSSEGLKISVQDQKSGKIYQIERHMIDGLPKTGLVPKEFFDCFYARVSTLVPEGHKVCFAGRLRGGMMSSSQESRSIMIRNIPNDEYEIESFYKNPKVVQRLEILKSSGNFTLSETVSYLQSGASAVVGAFFYGKTFPKVGTSVTKLHDSYFTLVADTCISFTKMQTNNILIVQQHVSSSKQISIGNLEEGLVQLREAPLIADKNIELCDELLAKADSMSQVVKDGRGGVTDASQQITGLEKDIETNSQELVILKQQMEQLKQEIKGALKELGGSVEEDDQKAYILNALTLGLFSVFGDKESAKTKALKRKINAFRDKKQECQEKEFELLRHKQTIIANMQKASGDFSSPEMAKNSLAMAEMALTEVRASVETYRCFMEEIKHQTTLALKGLESLIRFADTNYEALQGDTEHAKRVKNIFAGDFQSSAYQWLMLCCLGQTCRDALEGCKKTVFSKLSLKTEDQAEQKKIADKEIAHLKTILDSREKVKTKQIEYTREMSDSSNSDRLAEQVLDRGEPVIIEDF